MQKTEFNKTINYRLALKLYYDKKSIVLPNSYMDDWFECDILELSKTGLTTEYELKTSLSDFKNDAKKGKIIFERDESGWINKKRDVGQKYRMLENKDPKCPNYFYYVCPEDLLKVEDIPKFAGLIYVGPKTADYIGFRVKYIRKAKKIHSEKNPKILEAMLKKFFYRDFVSYVNSNCSSKSLESLQFPKIDVKSTDQGEQDVNKLNN
jgi:hypothetical protein